MSTVYNIQHTDPAVPDFIINPSQIDGFGGPRSNTSLILHGTGRLKYGEALNENFLHLLETFASPAIALPLITSIQSADNSGAIGAHFIKIFDDKTNVFLNSYTFQIVNSTGAINDGTYTVVSSSYDQPSNQTTIIIAEGFVDDNALLLGNLSYNITEPNPGLLKPPYLIGQQWFNKSDGLVYIFKDVNGSGALQWKSVSGLSISTTAPLFANDGDLWYDQSVPQLKVYETGNWVSVSDRYVLKSGDTLDTNAIIQFDTNLFFNEGAGNVLNGPDISSSTDLLLSSVNNSLISFDDNNDSTGEFKIIKGADNTTVALDVFTIQNNGVLHTDILNYETLLSDINDIPNKKYLDDQISALSSSLAFVAIAGDTMTGVLKIDAFGTFGTGNSTIPGDGFFGLGIDTTNSPTAGGLLIESANVPGDEHAIELVTNSIRKYDLRTNGDQYLYGDTLHQSGSDLILDHDPVLPLEATPKQYVDNEIQVNSKFITINYILDGNVASGNTIIPDDDTIPQITEGDQFYSIIHTPSDATNLLEIYITINMADSNANPQYAVTLFRDGAPDAIATGRSYSVFSPVIIPVKLNHIEVAGTTSPITFTVRAGSASGSVNTINGKSGTRRGAGTYRSGIIIKEVKA